MATPELDQVMFEAEVRRLWARGRWSMRERVALSSRATREGLDDSIVWMEPEDDAK